MSKLKLKNLSTQEERDLNESELLYIFGESRIKSYSITPKTLIKKTFVAQDSIELENPRTFIEEYKYGASEVTRFGIVAENIIPDRESNTLLGEVVEFISHDTKLTTAKTNIYTAEIAKEKILHTFEKAIITKAIESESDIVLVDFFERHLGNQIKLDEKGHPKIHTTLLYKQGTDVAVVDPSNFMFSSHLFNTNFNNELSSKNLATIKTIHKETKIYTPITETGSNFTNSRNCTDIAVKLAFALKEEGIHEFADAVLKVHPAIVRVSNNSKIDNSIIDLNIVSRIKQTSSLKAQEEFIEITSAISTKIKITKQCILNNNNSSKDLENDYVGIVQQDLLPVETLRSLLDLDKKYNDIIAQELFQSHQELECKHVEYTAELNSERQLTELAGGSLSSEIDT